MKADGWCRIGLKACVCVRMEQRALDSTAGASVVREAMAKLAGPQC
jgi:hypothetical protein